MRMLFRSVSFWYSTAPEADLAGMVQVASGSLGGAIKIRGCGRSDSRLTRVGPRMSGRPGAARGPVSGSLRRSRTPPGGRRSQGREVFGQWGRDVSWREGTQRGSPRSNPWWRRARPGDDRPGSPAWSGRHEARRSGKPRSPAHRPIGPWRFSCKTLYLAMSTDR